MFTVVPIPIFSDNYVWLIKTARANWLVDPGHAKPVMDYLQKHKIRPDGVLITHNHWDHVGGNLDLVRYYDIPVYGPGSCSIPGLSHTILPGQTQVLDGAIMQVLATPGHKSEHLSYYFAEHDALFCGDTLFSGGCGRVFDGSAEQLYNSLCQLAELPEQTQVYCTHEYTLNNLVFASAVEPQNSALANYISRCQSLRQQNQATLPTSISTEKAINPFLRCHLDCVKNSVESQLGHTLSNPLEVFKALRGWKDRA